MEQPSHSINCDGYSFTVVLTPSIHMVSRQSVGQHVVEMTASLALSNLRQVSMAPAGIAAKAIASIDVIALNLLSF